MDVRLRCGVRLRDKGIPQAGRLRITGRRVVLQPIDKPQASLFFVAVLCVPLVPWDFLPPHKKFGPEKNQIAISSPD
jgi:hypothetical protein